MDDDDLSPEEFAEAMQAIAMLASSEGGGAVRVDDTLGGRSDLEARLRQLDPILTAATFGGLLTAPTLQANACRIEALVHLAIANARGARKPPDKLVAAAFGAAGDGPCGYMEDPAEDVLVGTVRSGWGNHRVLEGLWEGGSFHLQRFVDVLESMPPDASYDRLRRPARALLSISEAVCDRARLERWQLGAEMPVDELPRRALSTLSLRRRHLRFTGSDLRAMGITPGDLAAFEFDMSCAAGLREDLLGGSALERRPLVARDGVLHLVLPTAVTSAIRYFVVRELEVSGMLDALSRALALSYARLIGETQLLGGSMPPDLRFRPAEGALFAETVMGVDAGRFIHFLFYTDPLTDLDGTGLAGVNPASVALGAEFSRRILSARVAMERRAGFRAGMSIIVGCGIGRGAAVVLDRPDRPGWRVEYCSAHDLITLGGVPDFQPTTLWRILDGRDVIERLGVRLQNPNGLVNLVAWSRALGGHLVPHERLPDDFLGDGGGVSLSIDQNRQRGLRHEVALATDPRVARFVDGRMVRIRRDGSSIFPDDKAAPLYASEDPGPSGFPMSAYLTSQRTWWADIRNPVGTGRGIAYERFRLVGTWLSRAAEVLDQVPGLPPGPILWEPAFESSVVARPVPAALSSFADARSSIRVEVDRGRRIIRTLVSEGFDLAQFHPDNIAERALVAALVHGAGLLGARSDPEALERDLVPLIVRNPAARHGHAFVQRGFRDMVRPDLGGRTVMIARDDDAFVRLGLGWSVRERSAGARLYGDECRGFLNALVRRIEDDIVTLMRGFNRRAMLGRLLRNHELAIFDRDLWRRTSSALLGLHGAGQDTLDIMTDHEFKLSAVFQSTRVLIEIAMCECPVEGGVEVAPLDLSLLMAKVALLVHMGGWSDAMRWGLMRPELRITPLGDVHANFDFVDEILTPHGRLMGEGRVAEAVDTYGQNMKDRPVSSSVEDQLDPLFVEAWTEQFGASVDETRILIDFLEDIGVEQGKAVVVASRDQLRDMVVGGRALDNSAAQRLVEGLTFRGRPAWRDVPDGFDDRDRQPWRYRRRLSFLRRPLLEIQDADEPRLLFAPGTVRDAFAYMMGNYLRGDFPDHQLTPTMKKWRAKTTGERGTVFATMVATALGAAGWETRTELNVTALLRRGFDRDYGDIDVLAWNRTSGRVLVIECKDVQFRKTYGEIAEQLADFRGEIRPNGRRDELRKHLDRMEVIRRHLDAVSSFTGMHPVLDVESHLMFRNPVPMEFALRRMAELVSVSRFDRIAEI